MDRSADKLELGMARLARARRLVKASEDQRTLAGQHGVAQSGAAPDRDQLDAIDDTLGLALLGFHGALEDHYRARFERSTRIPATSKQTPDGQPIPLRDMLKLMLDHNLLSITAYTAMRDATRHRNAFAHGERYAQTQSWLEEFAVLVLVECGYVAPEPSPASQPTELDLPQPAQRPAQPAVTAERPQPATRPIRAAVYSGLRSPDTVATIAGRLQSALTGLRRSTAFQRFLIFVLIILIIYLLSMIVGS